MSSSSVTVLLEQSKKLKNALRKRRKNSTLRYECDETFSDECEFAARAERESCNHTCQENVFRTSIVRNFISRGVKMRISARKACVRTHFHTRSEIKVQNLKMSSECVTVLLEKSKELKNVLKNHYRPSRKKSKKLKNILKKEGLLE